MALPVSVWRDPNLRENVNKKSLNEYSMSLLRLVLFESLTHKCNDRCNIVIEHRMLRFLQVPLEIFVEIIDAAHRRQGQE
jgi:hypothetical protein